MKCSRCHKDIYNIPDMESDTSEYFGTLLTTFEYVLQCEHCGKEYSIDRSQYYEDVEEWENI